jgi:hypothetical protein
VRRPPTGLGLKTVEGARRLLPPDGSLPRRGSREPRG